MTRSVKDMAQEIDQLEKELSRIQTEYSGEDILLDIYSEPYKYRLSILYQEIQDYTALKNDKVDFWLSIEGEATGPGTGSSDAISSVLSRFKNTTRQIIHATEHRSPRKKGRHATIVEKASDFEFIAKAAGSFKIGLRFPNISAQQDFLSNNPNQIDTESITELHQQMNLYAEINEYLKQTAHNAIETMSLVVASSTDERAKDQAIEKLGVSGLVRIASYISKLFPTGVDSIRISFIENTEQDVVSIDKSTRSNMKELVDSFKINGRLMDGFGYVGETDYTNLTIRLENVTFGDGTFVPSINADCKDAPGLELKAIGERHVYFKAMVKFDVVGHPKTVEVTEISNVLDVDQ